MNEVSQHKPAAARAGVWLSLFVGAFVLAIAVGSPLWIPEWEPFVELVIGALVLVAAWAGVALLRAVHRYVRQNVAAKWRLLVNVFGALVVFGVWAIAALLASVMLMDGFPFGATYYKQFEFPEHHTTLYLYDSSFLDPETTVFLRQGALPLRTKALVLGASPSHVDVVQHGALLMVNGRELDLVTGQAR